MCPTYVVSSVITSLCVVTWYRIRYRKFKRYFAPAPPLCIVRHTFSAVSSWGAAGPRSRARTGRGPGDRQPAWLLARVW
jgi:hypothetical protein